MKNEISRNLKSWQSLPARHPVYFQNFSEDLFETVSKVLPNPREAIKILRWYYAEDLTYKEIGDRLGISDSRVYQMIKEFKQTIKENFKEYELR